MNNSKLIVSKHQSIMKRTLTVFITLFLVALTAQAAPDIKDAIVKIYAVQNHPDYFSPWNSSMPVSGTGSGCVIKGRKVLTSAHVVSDSTYIQVRRYGDAKRFDAHVESISHDADLALLSVDDQEFFAGTTSLDLGELPAVQQEVSVYGYPTGGDTMSITRGVVSRVEHQVYVHSGQMLLAVQIDAAINSGNSGGPAIVDGRIAGVAMMTTRNANGLGYIVPTLVIRHFLDDIADGRHDGFPEFGATCQNIENPALKGRYQIPAQESGLLVYKIDRGGAVDGILQVGDVITRLDGQAVAGDGTVELRKDERTSALLIAQKHKIGEKMKVDIIRNGKAQQLLITLTRRLGDRYLVPLERYDVAPTYYIYGGLVFCPLTTDLAKAWGDNWYKDAPRDFLTIIANNESSATVDEVVVISTILPCNVNQGYEYAVCSVLSKVNGVKFRNLREMIAIIEHSQDQFVCIEDARGQQIVLDRKRCAEEGAAILNTYRIARDRSEDLLKSAAPVALTAK